ncbi:MAG: class I SAM-dependent methyltransferase [Candidatus Contendobacter sp.]|nr:MAG: class I SAM-dependent methyltransferase [Candidatus Contendobacter sp.]
MLQQRVQKIDKWRYSLIAKFCQGKTLDVGCGLQQLAAYLNKDHFYIGSDVEGGAVNCSAYKLPFSDGSFDTVILAEILEHLEMPLVALQEAARVSSKRIIVTVPNDYSLVRLARLLLGKEVEIEQEHLLSFNSFNLKMLLNRVNFNLIESFSFPLRIQILPEIPIRSRFGYWLFCVADRS